MPKAARKAKTKPKTARPPTRPALVPSPYGQGTDHVERIVDVVSNLYHAHQIDSRQRDAAEAYGRAHEMQFGDSLVGLLGKTTSVKATSGAHTPTEIALRAAQLIHDADARLGWLDTHIVHLIVVEGSTIAAAAGRILTSPSTRDCEYVGKRFRDALTLLADQLFGHARKPRSSSFRTADAKPRLLVVGEIPHAELKGAVGHAEPPRRSTAPRRAAYA